MHVSIEKTSTPEVINPGVKRRLMHLENLMMMVIEFENPMSEPLPPHAHPHEQISYIAEGELWFFLDEEKFLLTKGDMVKIPSGVMHTIQTIAPNCRLIDSFVPIREDFLKK